MASGGSSLFTPGGPEEEFVAMFRDLQRQIKDLRTSPNRIPVLAADPDVTSPINMWVLHDGRMKIRYRNTTDTAWITREYTPVADTGAVSVTAPPPPAAAPVSRQGTYPCTWSATYRQAGPKRTDKGSYLLWGDSGQDSFGGRNRSYIGFDYATIAAALAGSTITRVRLVVQALHTYFSTAKIGLGIHNQTAAPGSWAGTAASFVKTDTIGKTQRKELELPLVFGTSLRDGSGKGVALEAPNSSNEYYGYLAGFGSNTGIQEPTLIIDYAK